MLNNPPAYLNVTFLLTVAATLAFFYHLLGKSSTHASKKNLIFGGVLLWGAVQSLLALNAFYSSNTMSTPPRFVLAFVPALLLLLSLFLTKSGRAFMDSLPLRHMTLLSVVRVPVEFCLYWLFLAKAVPELMTFTGRNFDILAGITAPIVYLLASKENTIKKGLLLVWNIVSLCLLLFIIVNALLSAPTVLQQFAFDLPNIGILYFPFNLLPSVIVPIVLFTHFASIRRLLKK